MVALNQKPSVDARTLDEIVRRLRSVGDPLKIVMFGSYARGTPNEHSDLDLMIIEEHPDGPPRQRETKYYLATAEVGIPKDIVVYTPGEIQQWASVPMAFVTTAVREGRVLYERPH